MVLYTAPPGKMTIPDGLLINYLFVWFYFREPEKKIMCCFLCLYYPAPYFKKIFLKDENKFYRKEEKQGKEKPKKKISVKRKEN